MDIFIAKYTLFRLPFHVSFVMENKQGKPQNLPRCGSYAVCFTLVAWLKRMSANALPHERATVKYMAFYQKPINGVSVRT